MTRRFGCFLAAVVLLLTLAACNNQHLESPTEPSGPTLPSIPLEQTPAQMLSAAIARTETEESFEIRCGVRTAAGVNAFTQAVSPDRPLDREALHAKAPELPDREDFLEQFCGRSLTVTPSNTGTIRYQLAGLSWEDAQELLYIKGRMAPLEDALWDVTLAVDEQGRLCEFELTGQREEECRSAFLTITFPDSQ